MGRAGDEDGTARREEAGVDGGSGDGGEGVGRLEGDPAEGRRKRGGGMEVKSARDVEGGLRKGDEPSAERLAEGQNSVFEKRTKGLRLFEIETAHD